MCDCASVWGVAAVLGDRVAYGMVSCDRVRHCERDSILCGDTAWHNELCRDTVFDIPRHCDA